MGLLTIASRTNQGRRGSFCTNRNEIIITRVQTKQDTDLSVGTTTMTEETTRMTIRRQREQRQNSNKTIDPSGAPGQICSALVSLLKAWLDCR